jgi:hypothetical protein
LPSREVSKEHLPRAVAGTGPVIWVDRGRGPTFRRAGTWPQTRSAQHREVIISRLRRSNRGLAGLSGQAGHADHSPRATRRSIWTIIEHGLLPRTVQLCIHCHQNPAGYWVTSKNSSVVRRPWCLTCCQDLDLSGCEVTPFAS